jgi:hypothetical protein
VVKAPKREAKHHENQNETDKFHTALSENDQDDQDDQGSLRLR